MIKIDNLRGHKLTCSLHTPCVQMPHLYFWLGGGGGKELNLPSVCTVYSARLKGYCKQASHKTQHIYKSRQGVQ